MTAYNFQHRFAEAVADGSKRQTIRAHRKDGRTPHIGDRLQLFTGMRTKKCRKLCDALCVGVAEVTITKTTMKRHGMRLSPLMISEIAKADGFSCTQDFINFFEAAYGLPFSGSMINWERL